MEHGSSSTSSSCMPSIMDTLINCRKMNPSTAIASSILALLLIIALQLFFGVPEERFPAIKCTENLDGIICKSTATGMNSASTGMNSTATAIPSTATEMNSTANVEITSSTASDISSTASSENWTATETWFPDRHWTRQSKLSPAVRARNPRNHTMYGTLEAQHAIWNHQHPRSCHEKSFLVYEFLDVGRGIGSGIHLAGVALLVALNLNRILVLYPQPNVAWINGKFCEGMDTIDECYFEPLSSCTIFDAFGSMDVSNDNLRNFEEVNEAVYRNNSGRVLRTTVASGFLLTLREQTPVMFHGLLESGGISKEFYHWWRAQSAAYIVRPTLRTLRELDRRRGVVFQGRAVEPGTISIHVRHGDKWKETKLQDDETFLRSAEALVTRNGTSGLLERRIFLSTDDANTVRFFANLSNWTVTYTNVTRDAYKDRNVGPAAFAAMIGWDEEFLNSFLSLQLALECDGFVGMYSSNWNRLIDELRSTVACKHDRVYVDVVQGFHVTGFDW